MGRAPGAHPLGAAAAALPAGWKAPWPNGWPRGSRHGCRRWKPNASPCAPRRPGRTCCRPRTTLRALTGSETRPQGGWQPARVTARAADGGLVLAAGGLDAGAPVLDELGRLCGVVRSADADTAQADPPGVGRGAVPVLAGQTAGLLLREGGRLQVTGLPRHSSLAAGATVTTLDGQWVGRLAGAPEPDGTGLRETAP
ncbi:MAG: hypothetical protein ACLUUL_04360 [Gemmiger sp.]